MAVDRRKRVLVFALAAGCIASLTAYSLSGGNRPEGAEAEASQMVTVIFAKEEIPAGGLLVAEQLEAHQMPEGTAAPGSFSDMADVQGRYVRDRLLAGEQIVTDRLYDKEQAYSLPVTIPKGKRAVTVACNEVTGVAGFVKPGDFVDVLGTFDDNFVGEPVTVVVLQGVQVLAISQEMKKEESEGAKLYTSATLAVTLNQAQRLTLGEEKGRLRLVLRPPGAVSEGGGVATTTTALMPLGTPRPVAPADPRPQPVARTVTVRAVKAVARPVAATFEVEVIRGVSKETMQVPGK